MVGFDGFNKWGQFLEHSSSQWEQVPLEVKLDLTFEEFDRIRGKYGVVLVAPMLSGPKDEFVGCVCLDLPWKDHYSAVWTRQSQTVLVDTAEYIVGWLE